VRNPIVQAFWNRLLGDRGEQEAARHLRRQGLRILHRGYRTNQGEIDLIALDGNVVVFVEVKARRQGVPAEAVTPEKQRRLTLAALHFLKKHGLLEQRSRFDVVAIIWPDDDSSPQIEHIHDAFEAIGRGQMFR
jgi:putative endonuclease